MRVSRALDALSRGVLLTLCVALAWQALPAGQGLQRAELLAHRRDAVRLLTDAARADRPWADRRELLARAARHVRALADWRVPEAATAAPALDRDTTGALGRAAATLEAAAKSDDPQRPDAGPILALLERVRVRLEGEAALGLSLQGSFSQSRPKEAAYGGHASAMGPAPPPALEVPAPASSPVTFERAARLPSRTYAGGPTKDHILESAGNGVALFDYDGDGLLDIYLVTAPQLTAERTPIPHRNALYRNLGGWKFEDVSARAGVDAAGWGSGACVADVDEDGRLDLYVTNWGRNVLFRNRGDGAFDEIASRAGVAAGGWSTGCAFFDADADGDLDLYVARYVETSWDDLARAERRLLWRDGPRIMVGPAGLPGEADLYFENLGGGRFKEAAVQHGLADAGRAYGFAVVATDYDDDGFVDLFVANDSNPNFLYRNRGDGTFESVGLMAGVAVNAEARAQAGMGADSGDYDGDGRLDLVLTAFAHDRNTIYGNVDGRQFEDRSAATGLASSTFVRMGWGAAFLDADLDGALDLAIANGHIFADIDDYPQLRESFRQRSQLLLNRDGRFVDVSAAAGGGLTLPHASRGLAVGDLDNDGDLDIVISNMDDEPSVLENRQQTGHHWVSFRVASPDANRFAIGARVTIDAGGRQVREIRSGGSYLSQSDLRPQFGLGAYAGPIAVEVRMPGGRTWRWTGLEADRLHVLELTEARRLQGGSAR